MKSCKQFSALLISVSIFLISCASNDPETTSFEYPFRIGNSWEYRTTTIQNIFDEGILLSSDTLVSNSIVSVEGIEEVIPSYNTYVVHQTTVSDLFGTAEGYNYYHVSGDDLFLIAYRGSSFLAMPKVSTNEMYSFNGIMFSSFNEIRNKLEFSLNILTVNSDSLIIEERFPLVYDYPLESHKQWTYREFGFPTWRIHKVVNMLTSITAPAGTFDCYEIIWLYDIDNDSNWDNDIIIIDYVGETGLVKREIRSNNILFTDPDDPNGTEFTMNVTEVMELISFDLQQ
ncbi:hypothetical protein ACFLR4_04880 [Bacteroidota bacterium]